MILIVITHKKMTLQLLLNVFTVLLLLHMKTSSPGFINSRVAGTADSVQCKENERQALLKFKQEVIDYGGVLSSWGNMSDCCMWRGVGCDNKTGHVSVLNLRGPTVEDYSPLKLGGNISISLLQLQHLNYLDLSFNRFIVNLPDFIGSLSELIYLNLSGNFFIETLPYQLGNLSNLQSIDLSFNFDVYFESLSWLSHLSSLEHLDLTGNDLSVATDWLETIANLPNLKTLRSKGCKVSSIPEHFSFAYFSQSLSVLDLSANNLFSNSNYLQLGIPEYLGEMCNLQVLNFSNRNLNALLSESIQNLYGCAENSLEILSLSGNQLYGSLPDITRFSSLRELDLSFNQLNGPLYNRFRQHFNLHSLKLQGNKLTGSLPDWTMFPSLNFLSISGNQLDGTVSETIGSLSELEYLDISENCLQGVLCEAHFSKLTKLRKLDLSYNTDLALKIQDGWISTFQLDTLSLRSCNIGPRFPKWLQTQTNISALDLSNAGISETIPNWFWDLSPNLKFLNLSHNQMSGMLPNSLSSRSAALIGFDLSSNNFEGPIPFLPTNKISLLDLSNNMFSSSISFVCETVNIYFTILDLSNNQLSGRIPDCFRNISGLAVLNLGNNLLSGEIPNSVGSLSWLLTLSLRNNSLYGKLPSLMYFPYLQFLDLSENRLSGEIPAWIGESTSALKFLSLQSNEFIGSIPSHLCLLRKIHILDLSLNNISGSIPKCFNKLTAMVEKAEVETINLENTYSVDIKTPVEAAYQFRYINKALVEWKGRQSEYERNLGLLRLIDFAGNRLTGVIPEEMSDILQLMALNLSRNSLTGVIPQKIGKLKQLESLDLSRNRLSGAIPMSMTDLNFLSHLDLSFNNLSGKIPSSTQLQSFDASAFAGNSGLCGLPLIKPCHPEKMPESPPENEDNGFEKWFSIGLVTGFSACFCGVIGALLLNSSWRHSYFHFLDESKDWLYEQIAVFTARLQRKCKR